MYRKAKGSSSLYHYKMTRGELEPKETITQQNPSLITQPSSLKASETDYTAKLEAGGGKEKDEEEEKYETYEVEVEQPYGLKFRKGRDGWTYIDAILPGEDRVIATRFVLIDKPTPYEEAPVASYNVVCCYSKLNQVQAGFSALEEALKSGYEEFKRIQTDPHLENIRKSRVF
ncbi:hypothetical protein Bca4012_064468 [Brassica carinata]